MQEETQQKEIEDQEDYLEVDEALDFDEWDLPEFDIGI